VIEAWGFNYKTHAIWDKKNAGQGSYFRLQHELLLVATRGEVPEVPYGAREASVFRDRVGAPSEKPKRIRNVIDAMYPELKKSSSSAVALQLLAGMAGAMSVPTMLCFHRRRQHD